MQPRTPTGQFTCTHGMDIDRYRQQHQLCLTCGQPAAWLERLSRHGVYCQRHRQENIDNHKKWKERRRATQI